MNFTCISAAFELVGKSFANGLAFADLHWVVGMSCSGFSVPPVAVACNFLPLAFHLPFWLIALAGLFVHQSDLSGVLGAPNWHLRFPFLLGISSLAMRLGFE